MKRGCMGIFGKIFGKKKSREKEAISPEEQENMIRAFDQTGKEYLIPREEFRKNVLPGQFSFAQNDPDKLYSAIVAALQENFHEDCLEPARRLYEIDKEHERAANILGIVLMKNGLLDEAQSVLEKYIEDHKETGVVLTNLAKVYTDQGRDDEAHDLLWKALTLEPNLDNAMVWWGALYQEKGGADEYIKAMEKVAEIPGSWRAQLWIARKHLEDKKLQEAMDLYTEAMPMFEKNGEALMMISGDLCNNGYLKEAQELLLPLYKAQVHGPMAGLNLAQACLVLGDKVNGLLLCDELDRIQRFDFKQRIDSLRDSLNRL